MPTSLITAAQTLGQIGWRYCSIRAAQPIGPIGWRHCAATAAQRIEPVRNYPRAHVKHVWAELTNAQRVKILMRVNRRHLVWRGRWRLSR